MVHNDSIFIHILLFILCLNCFNEAFSTANTRWYEDTLEEMRLAKAVQQSMIEWKARSSRNRFKRAENSICYGDLGCFEDAGPLGYLDMLPSPPEEINTKFLVFSAKNRSGETPFHEFRFSEIAPSLNESSTPTDPEIRRNFSAPVYEIFGRTRFNSVRIIVHGFGSSCPHVWVYELTSALMNVEECLVICVDWENGATLPNYVRAATNTQLVGRQIALMLKDLVEHNQLEMSKVHIIGFSLGAHVAGFAGSLLPGLKRITGLDPAGPLFEAQHPRARLSAEDADYVDVIHSNGQNLILGGLGAWQPMGHADFYPNGGRGQHGCSNLFVGAITDVIWAVPATETEGRSLCNHRRAYKFFIDSVAPNCQFPAFPCDSYENFLKGECFKCDSNSVESTACGNMGYYADRSAGRGILYLKTREEEPFCAHQYQIRVYSAYHDLPLRTLGKIQMTLTSDGGLTEKFLVTQKDDDELLAGELISQIIVPHPALGFPTNVTLLYNEYKGWLTRGLATWSINKFIMSDSFGKTFSICKHMILESGVKTELKLKPGDCKLAEDGGDEVTTTTTEGAETTTLNDENRRNSISFEEDGAVPWMPIIPSFAPNVTTKNEEKTVLEPVVIVKPKREAENRTRLTDKRSFEVAAASPVEMKVKKTKNRAEENSTEQKSIMVQLFPIRIASMFEKAERYARQTILPYLTESFPTFFKPSTASFDAENDTNVIEDSHLLVDTLDTIKPEKRAFTSVRARRKMDKVDDYIHTYKNLSGIRTVFDRPTNETDDVRVDLPTFKPAQTITTRIPKYIPLERLK